MNNIALVWTALAFTPLWAFAQPPTSLESREPPRAAPRISYESAFEDYRAWQDEPIRPWREVNDEVRQVGGHAGVLKALESLPDLSRPDEDSPADPRRGRETTHGKGSGHAH